VLVEEGEEGAEHSARCTGRKEPGRSAPGAGRGTAPSGCGRRSSGAEAWERGGGRLRGRGPERRAAGRDAAWWESEEPVWVPRACSPPAPAGRSDSASGADRRRLPPSPADREAERRERASRAEGGEREGVTRPPAPRRVGSTSGILNVPLPCGSGSSEDLEMGNLSVRAYHPPPSHHLYEKGDFLV